GAFGAHPREPMAVTPPDAATRAPTVVRWNATGTRCHGPSTMLVALATCRNANGTEAASTHLAEGGTANESVRFYPVEPGIGRDQRRRDRDSVRRRARDRDVADAELGVQQRAGVRARTSHDR